ncbi:hypothetical protein V8E36_004969 [Tilletia maclaganii]
MKLTVASVLALAGAASAATDGPYSIGASPSGFETGVLNATLICNVTSTGLNLKNQQIAFGVAAILPNRVNASQPFNVIAGTRLIVPASINNLAYGFGARSYSGNATKVVINAKGSTPSSIDAAGTKAIPIPSAPIASGLPAVLNVPGNNGVISVGPFKPTASNTNVIFSFGDINAQILASKADGTPTILNATVACPAQARPASLAFVAAGGVGSTTTINPSGGGNIPTIPINSTAGTTAFTYSCTFTNVGVSPVTLSVGGAKVNNAPVTAGGPVAISLGQGNIFVTPSLTALFTAKYSAGTAYSLNVTTLNFNAVNASPASKNGIPSGGLSTPITPVSTTTTAVLSLPSGAPATTLPDITFTATTSGTVAQLSIGSAAGSVNVYNSANAVIATVPFTCPALSPAVPVLPYDVA